MTSKKKTTRIIEPETTNMIKPQGPIRKRESRTVKNAESPKRKKTESPKVQETASNIESKSGEEENNKFSMVTEQQVKASSADYPGMFFKSRIVWLCACILAEGLFKWHALLGFYAYLVLFIAGTTWYVMKKDVFLAILLTVPVIRIAFFGIPLPVDLKVVLGLICLGFIPLIMVIFGEVKVAGASLHDLDFLIVERKHLFSFLFAITLLWSAILGVFVWKFVENPSLHVFPLIIAVLSGLVFSLYFQGILLGLERSWVFLVLASLWFGVLVFSGNFVGSSLAFLFCLGTGFLFVQYRSFYVVLAGSLAFQLLPVLL